MIRELTIEQLELSKFEHYRAEDYRKFISDGISELIEHGMSIKAFQHLVGVLGTNQVDSIVSELTFLYDALNHFKFPDEDIRAPRFRSGLILALREYETKPSWTNFKHLCLLLQLGQKICNTELNQVLLNLITQLGIGEKEGLTQADGEALASLMLDLLANQTNSARHDVDSSSQSMEEVVYALTGASQYFRPFHARIALLLLARANPGGLRDHLKLLDPWFANEQISFDSFPEMLLLEVRNNLRRYWTSTLRARYAWAFELFPERDVIAKLLSSYDQRIRLLANTGRLKVVFAAGKMVEGNIFGVPQKVAREVEPS